MARHRLGRRQVVQEAPPAPVPEQDRLWERYRAVKAESGTDSNVTWDAFFEWWVTT